MRCLRASAVLDNYNYVFLNFTCVHKFASEFFYMRLAVLDQEK